MKKRQVIEAYETACIQVAVKINNLYFEGEADIDFVGGEIGGVCIISDYYFDMEFMLDALRFEATEDQFFGYYNTQVGEEPKINFREYLEQKNNK